MGQTKRAYRLNGDMSVLLRSRTPFEGMSIPLAATHFAFAKPHEYRIFQTLLRNRKPHNLEGASGLYPFAPSSSHGKDMKSRQGRAQPVFILTLDVFSCPAMPML